MSLLIRDDVHNFAGDDDDFADGFAFDGGGDSNRPNTRATSWGATNALYAITSYPTSILIDRNGNVAGEIQIDPNL